MRLVVVFSLVLLSFGCGSGSQEETYDQRIIRRNTQVRTVGSDAEMRNVAKALESYRADNDSYPAGDNYILLRQYLSPTYMTDLPEQDAWGNRYRYHSDGRSFRLSSNGQDRLEGTADDVVVGDGE